MFGVRTTIQFVSSRYVEAIETHAAPRFTVDAFRPSKKPKRRAVA
jgi:hypothetical protein